MLLFDDCDTSINPADTDNDAVTGALDSTGEGKNKFAYQHAH